MRFFFLLVFILGTFSLNAQQVQWASQILGFSSEYRDERSPKPNGALQILGEPNCLPAVEDCPCAWMPMRKDARQNEWIHVGFENAMPIRQVAIAENHNGGAITKVYAYDNAGNANLIYQERNNQPRIEGGGMLHIILPQKTNFAVKSIKIELSTLDVPGWNQIDAIAIADHDTPIQAQIRLASDIPFSEVETLGAGVNSDYDEILPVISPDGKTLYFDRKNHPNNTSSTAPGVPNDDIWFSVFKNGTWQGAEKMPAPLNNSEHNYVCSVMPDGNTLLLGNVYQANGTLTRGVSISSRTASGGWSFPEALNIKNFYNKNRYAEFSLSQNGKVLLLAIERDDTHGMRDLYVSFLQNDGSWSEPKNMGNTLNTAGSEITPFLASDMKSLYFASNGHSGYGKHDMFMSRRLDDTWTKWSVPVNLGPTLNSKDWDAAYSIDAKGEYAYFASNRGSNHSNIYRAKLPEEVRPEPVLLIVGTVYNSKTNEPIGASIEYEILSNGAEAGTAKSDPRNGDYKITLPLNQEYGFRAEAAGFFSVSENIDLRESEQTYSEIRRDLYLTPIEVGQSIRLNNVFFRRGTDELTPESFSELNRVIKIMTQNPSLKIEIGGHTDIEGIPAQNLKLSGMRVTKIKEYIVSKGIAKERIETQAYGSKFPITRNRDPESKRQNRRVEFKVLDY
ncbi:MAG: OmpA family protein [Bernardetiaceae bacterium]|nr:OmpA family protein [Bernardetiaceae bacterium]